MQRDGATYPRCGFYYVCGDVHALKWRSLRSLSTTPFNSRVSCYTDADIYGCYEPQVSDWICVRFEWRCCEWKEVPSKHFVTSSAERYIAAFDASLKKRMG
ncbi:hypothetical protein Tco_0800118 [Tanacetum coccineum]|uniref:Uncharacterized protein n=1 Tax=Tanacetum coccineum TaxID=301880 RepID=A0ABQ4ZS82_9ASTR